jgi:hypothetical protein
MSKKFDRLRDEAERRWPALHQFLVCYCHEDWSVLHGTLEGAIDAAIAGKHLEGRQQVAREWWDWNANAGVSEDLRAIVNRGFGVNRHFKQPIEARQFMDMVYDKLVLSIRVETGPYWRPDKVEVSKRDHHHG